MDSRLTTLLITLAFVLEYVSSKSCPMYKCDSSMKECALMKSDASAKNVTLNGCSNSTGQYCKVTEGDIWGNTALNVTCTDKDAVVRFR
jgi:hypothetical protein